MNDSLNCFLIEYQCRKCGHVTEEEFTPVKDAWYDYICQTCFNSEVMFKLKTKGENG